MEKRLMTVVAGLALSTSMAFAQSQISGKVTASEDGSPVIGASIKVVGTNTGTVTDVDGNFSLNAPAGAKLEISYIGMNSTSVKAGKNMKIVLEPDNKALDEVIVVAYGTAKKSAFTGSAGEVKASDIDVHVTSTATSALVGKVAGIQATSASGEPGSAPVIRVRGIGSLNASSAPLYIVDGAPYEACVANINPQDIESISVLKDASASAIYGARGANGVVIITTKRAKMGQDAQVKFDAKWGSNSRLIPQYDVIDNGAEYLETMYRAKFNSKYYHGSTKAEAYAYADATLFDKNQGGVGQEANVYTVPAGEKLIGTNFKLNPNATLGRVDGDNYYTTDDWYDETIHNSFRQEYNLSVSGAGDRLNYYASAGYLNDGGTVENSRYQRYTGRINVDYQAKKWLKLTTNMGFTHVDTQNPSFDVDTWGSSGNVFYICNMIAPIYPLYERNADGTVKTENDRPVYTTNNGSFQGNAVRDNHFNQDKTYQDIFTGQWTAVVTPVEGLNLTASLSASSRNNRENQLLSTFGSGAGEDDGIAYVQAYRYFTVNQQYLATYSKSFGKHNASLLAGYEQYKFKKQRLYGQNNHLYNPFIGELGNAYGTSKKLTGSYTDNYMTEGFFGRAQYDYDGKYFGSASFRRDASSVFAPGHRWGSFYSVGAAWLISKESFLSDVKWVSLLKLKASYGEQGNDNLASVTYYWHPYADMYSASYDETSKNYSFNMVQKGNENLTWETSKAWNFGVDFELFKSRLNGSFEYYVRNTSDLLFFKNLPLSSGISVSSYPDNIGSMRNQGYEFSLEGVLVKNRNIEWSLNANISHNKNEITKLDQELKYSNQIIKKGGSVYEAYMIKYAGVDHETGSALYYMDETDKDGNVTGMTTTTDITKATKYDCGTTLPKFNGGFGTNVAAYGFDLSAQFSFQLGGKIYDGTYQALMHNGLQAGQALHRDALNAWSETNKNSNIPRLSTASTDDAGFSSQTPYDRFLTSSNYLSLNNLTLGYTLPKDWVRALTLSNIRVYVSGENLFLLTKRKGLDPRFNWGIGGMTSGSGKASGGYASMRTVTAGISVNF